MLLKKAGMVVLGAAAGVAALSGTAFAGDMPSSSSAGHEHSWDGDHSGHHHGGWDRDDNSGRFDHNFTDDDNNATAVGPQRQINTGDQLIGVNNTNLQAPISAVLSVLGTNNL